MADSDPYDDDFFDDPAALSALDDIETQAISASQLPRTAAPPPAPAAAAPPRGNLRHHYAVPPRSSASITNGAPFGRTKAGRPRDPPPLSTAPGVTGGGFGWEHGGKRSIEGNVQRHLAAVEKRQAYWEKDTRGMGSGAVLDEYQEEEDYPDVVVDARGNYGLADVQEEDQVLDTHNVSESLAAVARQGPGIAEGSNRSRAQSEEAKLARRAAILNGNGSGNVDTPGAGPSRLGPGASGAAYRPPSSRPFNRSVSANSHMFNRPQPIAGPSRIGVQLPTIPAEPGDAPSSQPTSSQGSSGAMLRKTYLELEQEKARRVELERKIAELERKEAAAETSRKGDRRGQVRDDVAGPDGDEAGMSLESALKRVAEVEQLYFIARGAEATVRKNLEADRARHAQDMARKEQEIAHMKEDRVKAEKEAVAKTEAVRVQAIFNNQANYSTIARSRHAASSSSSQRPRGDWRTPMPPQGSPSRRANEEARPLMLSSKGKGKATAPAQQPGFRGFTNAFDTPAVSRSKRIKTEGASPSVSPRKHAPASQARSQTLGDEHGDDGFMDVDMGADEPTRTPEGSQIVVERQEQVTPGADDAEDGQQPLPLRDLRSELIRTVVTHNAVSDYQSRALLSRETTLRRLLAMTDPADGSKLWNDSLSELLASLGDASLGVDELGARVVAALDTMLECLLITVDTQKAVCVDQLGPGMDIFSLLSCLVRQFPPLADRILHHNAHGHPGGTWAALVRCMYSSEVRGSLLDANAIGRTDPDWDHDRGRGCETDLDELGCMVGDLGEALCLYGTGSLDVDALVDVMLILMERYQAAQVVLRGVQMFHAAATFSSHFRMLTALREDRASPVERVARYLIAPRRRGTADEILATSITIVRALSMLTVADPGGVVLIAEKSVLVPCLIQLLDREVRKVWGINPAGHSVVDAAALIYPTLLLLRMLVYPHAFSRSALTHDDALYKPSWPLATTTISTTGVDAAIAAVDGAGQPRAEAGETVLLRPPDVVAAERRAFLDAQERIMSALADLDFESSGGGGGGGHGDDDAPAGAGPEGDTPPAINLAAKLLEWQAVHEWAGVRHMFLAAFSAMAYDDLLEEVLVARMEGDGESGEVAGEGKGKGDREGEGARLKRAGWRVGDVLEVLKVAQFVAQDLLEAVFEGPETDEIFQVYSVDEEDMGGADVGRGVDGGAGNGNVKDGGAGFRDGGMDVDVDVDVNVGNIEDEDEDDDEDEVRVDIPEDEEDDPFIGRPGARAGSGSARSKPVAHLVPATASTSARTRGAVPNGAPGGSGGTGTGGTGGRHPREAIVLSDDE